MQFKAGILTILYNNNNVYNFPHSKNNKIMWRRKGKTFEKMLRKA